MPRMYDELAGWWPLLSAPDEYEEEARAYGQLLAGASQRPLTSLLELGSGGGNNASHLKRLAPMTLVEPSAGMRSVSEALNPECEHVEGDMRTVRLGRTFDAVFVHDAICYMSTGDDLQRALDTAFVHCRPGGVALLVPDFVRETFEPSMSHGGRDDETGRGLRYLEWCWDPDPADTAYVAEYALLLREAEGTVRAEHDRHVEGLFPRQEWLDRLHGAGFASARVETVTLGDGATIVETFLATRGG